MDLQLAGKRALVTGSTSGIGFCHRTQPRRRRGRSRHQRAWPRRAASRPRTLPGGRPGAKVRGIAADLGTATGCEQRSRPARTWTSSEQHGDLRSEAFEEIPDEEGFPLLRDQRDERRPPDLPLPPGHEAAQLGPVVFISSESGICPPAEMVHYGMSSPPSCPWPAVSPKPARVPASPSIPVLPGPTHRRCRGHSSPAWPKNRASRGGGRTGLLAHARPTRSSSASSTPPRSPPWSPMSAVRSSSATHGAALRFEGGVVRSMV